MKIVELLDKANSGYPDGYLENYYEGLTGKLIQGSGDTLAEFIVRELQETFNENLSDEKQIDEAIRVLENARQDLDNTIIALRLRD